MFCFNSAIVNHLIKEPLEALALKLVAKFLPRADVSKVTEVVPDPVVVILLIIVQPNLIIF